MVFQFSPMRQVKLLELLNIQQVICFECNTESYTVAAMGSGDQRSPSLPHFGACSLRTIRTSPQQIWQYSEKTTALFIVHSVTNQANKQCTIYHPFTAITIILPGNR